VNAALFAVAMLAADDEALAKRLEQWRSDRHDAAASAILPPTTS
jgi:phosphoribosylcarboxyaminoimidazole (NCAIR) mutase